MTSDKLDELPPDHLRLWKLLLNPERRICRFPFLGKTSITYGRVPGNQFIKKQHHEPVSVDPVLVQVRTSLPAKQALAGEGNFGSTAVLIFNTGNQTLQRSYTLASLGLPGTLYLYDWDSSQPSPQPVENITVILHPHESKLFFLAQEPISTAPLTLP